MPFENITSEHGATFTAYNPDQSKAEEHARTGLSKKIKGLGGRPHGKPVINSIFDKRLQEWKAVAYQQYTKKDLRRSE